jgi:phosphoglycolate phosphatase
MKLIIFDMDGTLINSGNIIANTINHVRTNTGLSKLSKECLLKNINNPHINSAKFFYGTDQFTKQHTQLFEQYYEQNYEKEIVLYDGIQKLLARLHKDFILTIATNANTTFAIQMTQHLDIYKYFQKIVGANMVLKSKPDPEMLHLIIDEFKYQKKNTILVGDSDKDRLAASNANIDFLAVNWGFTPNKKSIQTIKELEDKLYLWDKNG